MKLEHKARDATVVVDCRQMVGILILASREALYGHSIVHDGWILLRLSRQSSSRPKGGDHRAI